MVVGHPVYLPFRIKFRGNRVKRLKKSRGNRKEHSLSIDNLRFIY